MIGLLALAVATSGCSGTGDTADVEQKIWILESLAQQSSSVVAFGSVMPHLTLAEGKVSGNLTVNTFNGTYERSGNDISFSQLASTRMAGPPEAMEQETQFMMALEKAAHLEVQDGVLTFLDSDDAALVQLTEALEG